MRQVTEIIQTENRLLEFIICSLMTDLDLNFSDIIVYADHWDHWDLLVLLTSALKKKYMYQSAL